MTAQMYHIRGSRASEISASVEAAIREGRAAPGELLPSVRALAEDLGVSPVTVASAYASLKARGLVTAEGRRGTRVAPRPPLALRASERVPPGIRDLAGGNPDPAMLPTLERALRAVPRAPRLYGEPPTLPALAERARADLEADGIPAESLTVTAGALDGIERVLDAHLGPGDRVAVEDPGFGRVFDLLAAYGLVPEPVAVDDAGPIPASLSRALRRGARAVLVTPRAQNPTGAAIDAGRARELRTILRAAPDVLLVEDDHAGPVCGAEHRTLVERGRARWAVVRSYSKSLGPDLRAAVMAGDETTIARVEGRLAAGMGWVSTVLQHLVVALLDDPAVTRTLARAAKTYTRRRDALIGALAEHGIAAHGRSGLNVMIPVPDEQRVVEALARAGYGIRAGSTFRLESPPFVRVTISTLLPGEAPEVAAQVARALKPMGAAYSA